MVTDTCTPIEQIAEIYIKKRVRRTFFDIYARQWMAGVLMLTDVFCLVLAIAISLQLRWFSVVNVLPAYEKIFVFLSIILLLKFYLSGLYSGVGLHYIDEIGQLVNSLAGSFVIVLAATFLEQTSLLFSRSVILLIWLLSTLFMLVGRYLVRRLLIHMGLWGVPVVIIGSPERAQALAKNLRINLHHGVRPDLIMCDEFCDGAGSDGYPAYSLDQIRDYSNRLRIYEALILVDDLNDIDRMIDRYRFIFHRVILVKDQTGKYGLNNLQPLDFANTLGLQVNNKLLSKYSHTIKRFFDVIVSFITILLLFPIIGLVALLIRIDSPGGAFYRQPRIGQHGKRFEMVKFRTMHPHAEEILKVELARNLLLKEEWDCYQKLKEDPRVTRVGKFLRRFSVDELPQIWNIVRGEMSLVGPRPILLDQREMYGASYKDYIQVKPGMTGLWQISGRNQTSFSERAALDNEYIQRWSLWMDFFILFKTIKVVLWQEGAF